MYSNMSSKEYIIGMHMYWPMCLAARHAFALTLATTLWGGVVVHIARWVGSQGVTGDPCSCSCTPHIHHSCLRHMLGRASSCRGWVAWDHCMSFLGGTIDAGAPQSGSSCSRGQGPALERDSHLRGLQRPMTGVSSTSMMKQPCLLHVWTPEERQK
jgi:hypothetical protein